jgi:hypothetical protein
MSPESAKGLLNNKLYKSQNIGYVLCSEKLHPTEVGPDRETVVESPRNFE